MIGLSEQEHSLLEHAFLPFLEATERQGASFAEMQALLLVLQKLQEFHGEDEVLETLLARVTNLLDSVMPDPLTLEEAATVYHVNAATLRRACWAGKLPAKQRGKSWFVNSSDLEHYFAANQNKRTRRSQ